MSAGDLTNTSLSPPESQPPLPPTSEAPPQTTPPPPPETSSPPAPPPAASPPAAPPATAPPPAAPPPAAPPPAAPPPAAPPPAVPPPVPPPEIISPPPPSVPVAPPPSVPAAPPPDPASSPPLISSPPSPGVIHPSPLPSPNPTAPSANFSPPPPDDYASPPPPAKDVSPPPTEGVVSPPSSSPTSFPPPPKSSPSKYSPPPNTIGTPPSSTPGNPPPPRGNSTLSPSFIISPPPPSDLSPSASPSTRNGTEKPTAKSAKNSTGGTSNSKSNYPSLSPALIAAIGVVVGFALLTLLVGVVWVVRKRRRRGPVSEFGYALPSPYASSQNSDSLFLRAKSLAPSRGSPSGIGLAYSSSESGGFNQSKSWFTYDELVQATDEFSKDNLLGEGGFGCVYKGFLIDGREVAVKQLKIGGNQGEREFRAEVEIIGRIHHRHLVSLVGYCIDEYQRLLVYDYLPNNTLHYHLHGNGRPVLNWATRVKIAAGAARGLAYLHEDCHPRIIHRDIKSSNILLDSNFEARVSDFGLAKLAQELDSNTHVSTRVMGTFGYLAPEYATSGKLTEKSDVYSFGVVLLEMITGRKPVDASQPIGEESLVEWARPLMGEALEIEVLEALTDPKLEKSYVATEMFRMIEAAAACVRHSAARRPRMSQVARALDSLNEQPDLSNGMKPGQSEIFNSRDQSAQIKIFQRLAFGSQDFSSNFFDHSLSSWKSRDRREQGSHV